MEGVLKLVQMQGCPAMGVVQEPRVQPGIEVCQVQVWFGRLFFYLRILSYPLLLGFRFLFVIGLLSNFLDNAKRFPGSGLRSKLSIVPFLLTPCTVQFY